MPHSIPRVWIAVLIIVVLIAAGGAFWVFNQDKKHDAPQVEPDTVESLRIGVMNMEKVIAAHPKYSVWTALKQEEETLRGDFEKTRVLLLKREETKNIAMHENMGTVLEQEFNAKIKAKQDELNEKIIEKTKILGEPLNRELQEYIRKVEEEYRPQLFDLNLKLRVLQVDEPQGKAIVAKIEELKQEQSSKIETKNRELAQKMDELLAPEIKKFDEEMNRYASELNAELSAKMAAGSQGLLAAEAGADMPPELKKMEENIVAKRQEVTALYDGMAQDVRYKTIDVAVKHGLEAVMDNAVVNFGALDITDLVIAEFRK